MYNVLIPRNYFSHVISRRVLKIFIICSCIAICYILTLISNSNSDDILFSCFISYLVSQHSSVDSLYIYLYAQLSSLFFFLSWLHQVVNIWSNKKMSNNKGSSISTLLQSVKQFQDATSRAQGRFSSFK